MLNVISWKIMIIQLLLCSQYYPLCILKNYPSPKLPTVFVWKGGTRHLQEWQSPIAFGSPLSQNMRDVCVWHLSYVIFIYCWPIDIVFFNFSIAMQCVFVCISWERGIGQRRPRPLAKWTEMFSVHFVPQSSNAEAHAHAQTLPWIFFAAPNDNTYVNVNQVKSEPIFSSLTRVNTWYGRATCLFLTPSATFWHDRYVLRCVISSIDVALVHCPPDVFTRKNIEIEMIIIIISNVRFAKWSWSHRYLLDRWRRNARQPKNSSGWTTRECIEPKNTIEQFCYVEWTELNDANDGGDGPTIWWQWWNNDIVSACARPHSCGIWGYKSESHRTVRHNPHQTQLTSLIGIHIRCHSTYPPNHNFTLNLILTAAQAEAHYCMKFY